MGSGRGQRQGQLWNSPNGDIHSLTETPSMSETRPWGKDNSTITAKLESRLWLACSCWGKKDEKITKYLRQAPGPACWTQPWGAGPWQEPGARGCAYNWMGLEALRVLLWGPCGTRALQNTASLGWIPQTGQTGLWGLTHPSTAWDRTKCYCSHRALARSTPGASQFWPQEGS